MLVFIAGFPPNASDCTLFGRSENDEFTNTLPLGSLTYGSPENFDSLRPSDVSERRNPKYPECFAASMPNMFSRSPLCAGSSVVVAEAGLARFHEPLNVR